MKKKVFNLVCALAMMVSMLCLIPQIEASAISQSNVQAKLQTLMDQYNGKTANANQMYMGSQCKGFANWVFLNIFGVYIGAYPESANYMISNPQAEEIGVIHPGNLNETSSRNLLQKAAPGDYIQVQRSVAHSNGKCGPHSMIVVGVRNDGVEVFDCNSDGKNTIKKYLYTWSKFDYQNRAMSLYRARNYEYGTPSYDNTVPLTSAKVSLNKSTFQVGENVTFNLSSVGGTSYTVGIDDASGTRIDTHITRTNSYTRTFTQVGEYSCYISALDDYGGLVDSERIYFKVYDKKPEKATVSIDKKAYYVGENVVFHLSSDTGNAYTVGIDDANGTRIDTYNTNTVDTSYVRSFSQPGEYSCYISAYNNIGQADSERIYFTVYNTKPSYAQVSLDKRTYCVGENVVFHLSSDAGNSYTVGIDDANGKRIDTYNTGLNECEYVRTFSQPGEYSCYITTYNNYGLADSERIYFSVYSDKPQYAKVSLYKDAYMVGEDVVFELSSDTGVLYTVGIDDADGNRIDTYNTNTVDTSYVRSFDQPGEYSCYITAYNGIGLTDSERIYFKVYDSKPSFAKVTLDQSMYAVGENVTFHLNSDTGVLYTIGIDDRNGQRIFTYSTDTKTDSYSTTFTEPGEYSCYITAHNGVGLTNSERIYFKIYGDKPGYAKVSLDKSGYSTDEEVAFHLLSDTGIVYTVGIDNAKGKRIDTHVTAAGEELYTRTFTEPGEYSCYITAHNGIGLTESERIYFTIECGHSFKEMVKNANCTESGYTEHICTLCGNSYRDNYREALGHDYGEGLVVRDATENEKGILRYTCKKCGDEYEETIKKISVIVIDAGKYEKEYGNQDFSLNVSSNNEDIRYQSGDTNIVTVTPEGIVSIKKTGRAIITVIAAESNDYSATEKQIEVIVHRKKPTIEASSLFVDTHCKKADLQVVTDSDGKLFYTSGDTSIVTVDEQGSLYLTGKEGEADIRIQSGQTEFFEKGEKVISVRVNPAVHEYVEEITQEATCTVNGIKSFTCKECGSGYTEEIPATGHDKETINKREATCTEKGYTGDCYCRLCDTVLQKGETVPEIGHSWNEGVVTKEAACEANGSVEYKCADCSKTRIEEIPALEHSWDDGVITEKATCSESGVKTYTCTICLLTKTEDIPCNGHTGETETRNVVKATCAKEGYTGDIYCKACGKMISSGTAIAKTKHQWDAGKVTTKPTGVKKGVKTYTCKKCKTQRKESIKATGLKPGTKIKDTKSNGIYKVAKDGLSVEYTTPINKKKASVSIPDVVKYKGVACKVTSIGVNAFKGNKYIKQVSIGNNVVSIGKDSFSGCKKLSTVTFGKKVASIGNNAFSKDAALAKLTLPASVKTIGSNAFADCKKLKNITIKTKLLTNKSVGAKAFKGTNSKPTISVPKSVYASYKKLLKTKGMSGKAKYKKF